MSTLVAGKVLADVDGVIFDKDGTLFDFMEVWQAKAHRRVDVLVERFGVPAKLRSLLLSAIGVDVQTGKISPFGPIAVFPRQETIRAAVDVMAAHGYDKGEAERICREAFAVVDLMVNQRILAKLIPGVPEMLARLKASGLKLAIVTADTSQASIDMLEDHGLTSMFDAIVAADHLTEAKPEPEVAYEVCKMFHVDPGRVAVVGDAIVDVELGRNAGAALSVGVTTGVTSREVLEEYADVVIDSVAELNVQHQS